MDIMTMTDAQLLEEFTQARKDCRYYDAAEGKDWSKEQEARTEAIARYNRAFNEIKRRGLQLPPPDLRM